MEFFPNVSHWHIASTKYEKIKFQPEKSSE